MLRGTLIALIVLLACNSLATATRLESRDGSICVVLNEAGEIASATAGEKPVALDLLARTRLAGCKVTGVPKAQSSPDAMTIVKKLLHSSGRTLTLTERFSPRPDSVRWDIEIESDGAPWTTNVLSEITMASEGLEYWTAWASGAGSEDGQTDPLQSYPFNDMVYHYGSYVYPSEKCFIYIPQYPDVFNIPLVTLLDSKSDTGLTMALDPTDTIIAMKMRVNRYGKVAFERYYHRFGEGRTVKFGMDLTAHVADWRAGLAWMRDHYAEFFHPNVDIAHEVAGLCAYSSHMGEFDVEKYKKMGFRVNWKASFDFPYMGMFLPPVPDTKTEWTSFRKQPVSPAALEADAKYYRDNGLYQLNYFNIAEFGTFIRKKRPRPESYDPDDPELWKDPNKYLYAHLSNAILPVPHCDKREKPGDIIHSWIGCLAMDPGEPDYQRFLLEQARRHVKYIPSAYGITIDRLDWARFFNDTRDDGVTWLIDRPAYAMVNSFKETFGKIADIMHPAGKVIYANNHDKRIDLLRYVDGLYDEFSYNPFALYQTGLLCINKPALGWVQPDYKGWMLDRKKSDPFLQNYIYMGVLPTAPFIGNDHSLNDDVLGAHSKIYMDYALMFNELRKGKQWVLTPRTFSATVGRANLFSTFDGYIMPIMLAGDETEVDVSVNLKNLEGGPFDIEIAWPGGEAWQPYRATVSGSQELAVPLVRGCAMLRLVSHKKD